MFDFIRSHQRLMQLVLLLLIVPSFVFFGVQGYERMGQQTQSIAKVGGQPISQGELDNAQREQLARMRQTYGASVDASMFDTPEARAQALDGLISQHVLMLQAQRQSLGTSDRKLQETIMAIPALQEDGHFSQDRYQALLAQQGMTPAVFEQRLRDDLAMQQLNAAIENSVIVPKRVVDSFSTIIAQRREVRPMTFKVADYAPQVKLATDAVQKDYDAHPNDFMTPETAKVEYIVLSADALAKQVTVPEADARAFYEQNKKRYEVPEQRRASHILVAVAKDASDADKAKAKAKAEDLLKKVRASSPANLAGDFAKLAKQSSDDPGSAANGGDLDYLGRGATVPPFENALFALKDKEISDLVQSDFGYHIIELTGVKPAEVKSFDSVKGEITAEMSKQLAQKKFTDAAEAFANGVYEQGDALAPTAQKFGLTVMTADKVARTPAPTADTTSPLTNAKLLTALFSTDSIKNHHNTEAVETTPGTLVSARIIDYAPAAKRPLTEVADAIKARLTDVEARKLAVEAGQAELTQLRAGDAKATGGKATFGAPITVSRVERSDAPPEAVTEIFRTDASKLPAYAGLVLGSGDYAIYQIANLTSVPDADPARRVALTQSIAKQLGTIEFSAYLADLRRRIKVQVSPPYADLIEKKDAAPAKTTS
jgi:peptidyl-prolyl cis-trans isomerase D